MGSGKNVAQLLLHKIKSAIIFMAKLSSFPYASQMHNLPFLYQSWQNLLQQKIHSQRPLRAANNQHHWQFFPKSQKLQSPLALTLHYTGTDRIAQEFHLARLKIFSGGRIS